MDTQKEREAFEDWYIHNMDTNGDFEKISEQDSPYMDDHVNNSWSGWQAAKAQAVPDGFVVVPKEPTEAMLDASRRRQWDDLSSPYEDMDMLKYKAMIEAQEPK